MNPLDFDWEVASEILEEIRKTRDKDALECGYDVHRLFGKLREETENYFR